MAAMAPEDLPAARLGVLGMALTSSPSRNWHIGMSKSGCAFLNYAFTLCLVSLLPDFHES
jgi:hypothetical protein